ncbi:TolC family protein [Parasediminibacterium paludis]|uniref:TolC family protein n=1 Tax=Parasediminibacterium paludis TaxID=908966 RepID=A0ABV8PYQ0_9BACT
MKPAFTLIALAFLLQLTAQTTIEKWDLRKCVDYAMKNNISVKQADIQARIGALQLKQAQLYQYPTASFSTNIGPQFGRSIDPTTNVYTNTELLSQNYGLQGSVQLFNWGRLKNNTASQDFSAKAALKDIEKAANDVALNVATYYLQILASKEQVNIVAIQIQQTQSQLDVTQKKVIAGALPELNALELEAKLATDSSNYIAAASSFQQNVLQLKALLTLDAAAPFEVEIPAADKIPLESLADLQPETVYALAINNQPNIIGNQLRIKSAEKSVLSLKSALYPTIGASYSIGSTYNNKAVNFLNGNKIQYFDQLSQNFRQSVGLGVSVPIFSNGTNRINYEQSKLTLQNYKVTEDQIEQKLKQDIYTAYTNVINALQKFNAGKKQVENNQKALDFATKRYEVGLLSTIDLITIQNNLATAQIQQISNQYDYVFKMKLLEFYKGQGLKL